MKGKKNFISYFLKFLSSFCVLYYGTIALIGLTTPGGYYSSFAEKYFNYVAALRYLLLHCAKLLLELFGFDIYLKDAYTLKMNGGSGVHVGYDCIGYGVMFFWIAFIYANNVSFVKRLQWLLGGLLLIWLVNVIRIALMLVAVNQHWKSFLNLDNHTLFNIAAYTVIFTMIFFFDKSLKKESEKLESLN